MGTATAYSKSGKELVRRRIASLDGLRAVAILLVLYGHASTTFPNSNFHHGLITILDNGALGVSLFFCISGFLITHLLLSEQETSGAIDISAFYLRRCFRILPAFYFYTITIVVVDAFDSKSISLGERFATLLLVRNYYFGGGHWDLGHTWSLAVEEQFYIIWPWLLARAKEIKAQRVATWLIVLSPMIRLIFYIVLPADLRGATEGMLPAGADSIMYGALAAFLYRTDAFQDVVKLIVQYRLHLWSMVFAVFINPFLRMVSFRLVSSSRLGVEWGSLYEMAFGHSLESLAVAIVVIWAIAAKHTSGGRLLNSAPLVGIGAISYSLYLWQQPFLNASNTTILGRVPINLVCACSLAYGSYWLIERPFLRLRLRMASLVAASSLVGGCLNGR